MEKQAEWSLVELYWLPMSPLSTAEVLEVLHHVPSADVHPFAGKRIGECIMRGLELPYLADFQGAVFTDKADFRDAEFQQGASFIDTVFECGADFDRSKFRGPAFFWKCRFVGNAGFSHLTVIATNRDDSKRYPGEANFSYTIFDKNADFRRARFGGKSFFHRSVFRGECCFEEARFDDLVKFEGLQSDICLGAGELSDSSLVDRLLRYGLLIKSADHDGFYNFDPRIKTDDRLRERLCEERFKTIDIRFFFHLQFRVGVRKALNARTEQISPEAIVPFTETEAQELESLRKKYALPIFSGEFTTSFVRTEFVKGAIFSQLSHAKTLFQEAGLEAGLENVRFIDVAWDNLPLTFGIGTRRALHDEAIKSDTFLLESAYHDIRLGYQKRGEIDPARDFYYGELEMQYRAKPAPWRWLSLEALYKVGSGFGRQESLAGIWLIIFIFLLFPLLYASLDRATSRDAKHPKIAKALRAEAHSMEACTFIARDQRESYTNAERLIAGAERLAVAVQAGLFILATKWKFERYPGNS